MTNIPIGAHCSDIAGLEKAPGVDIINDLDGASLIRGEIRERVGFPLVRQNTVQLPSTSSQVLQLPSGPHPGFHLPRSGKHHHTHIRAEPCQSAFWITATE